MPTGNSSQALARKLLAAAGKLAQARFRALGMGGVFPDWQIRAAACERCPLRVVSRGISYCGTPFLEHVDRDETIDGCGCACRDKAKSPGEHCPIDLHIKASAVVAGTCNCKWCQAVAAEKNRRDCVAPASALSSRTA